MEDNNYYKFVGVINFFGIYPDFVCPVFEKNGKYFFQRLENGIVTSFKEIKEEIYLMMIRFLDVSKFKNINMKHFVGSKQIVAFQLDKNNFFIGDIDAVASLISTFETDDNILREEIDIFLDKVNRRNNSIKIKEKHLNSF